MNALALTLALLARVLVAAPADSIAPDQSSMSSLTATNFAKGMRVGWNVGNSLEAVDTWSVAGVSTPCETCWGNPLVTQTLIDSIKAAGFNAIRLPVSWSRFTGDTSKFVIDPSWIARVKTVVDYAISRDMYVVMNEHWDGGWLQPLYADSAYANRRLRTLWKQVAIEFRDYGDHLLFAGTNEVMKTNDYGTPTTELNAVQNGFNQIFVKTVRATGGRNAYRYLVVQGFNTNIDHAVSFLKIPTDPATKRLLVEVHFYDPYDFTLNENNAAITQWGATATSSAKTAGWGNESSVDAQMAKMKSNFADKGYPVIIGEYGAIAKNTSDNPTYRKAWNAYVTKSAVNSGAIPFYWDNGATGTNGMGLFERSTGKQSFPDIVQAIVAAAPAPVSVHRTPSVELALVRNGGTLECASAFEILDLKGRLEGSSNTVGNAHMIGIAGLAPGLHLVRTTLGTRTITLP